MAMHQISQMAPNALDDWMKTTRLVGNPSTRHNGNLNAKMTPTTTATRVCWVVVAKDDEGSNFEIDHFDGTRSFANIKEMPLPLDGAYSPISDPITLAMTSSNDSITTTDERVGVRQRLLSTGGSILRKISRGEGDSMRGRRSLSRGRARMNTDDYDFDDDTISRSAARPRSATADGIDSCTSSLSASCHTPTRSRSFFGARTTGDKNNKGLSASVHGISPKRLSKTTSPKAARVRSRTLDSDDIDAEIENAARSIGDGLSVSLHGRRRKSSDSVGRQRRSSSKARVRSRTLDGADDVLGVLRSN